MQAYLGEEGHEITDLVDTGSELNIIPEDSEIKAGLTTRCLKMNLRGIGADIEGNVGYTELTKHSKEEGPEQKTENHSFNQKEENSINMKEPPISTTKEHKVTETKIQNKDSDIFFHGQNKEEMGIHKEFTYPINIEDCMENKPELHEMWSLNTIKNSTNSKEEDSPAPYHYSNKEKNNLTLGIN
ncbi:hypothetical protein O181_091303 [Austropuccinia psidii MF-1]|uniref:Peptidase A2 domain-containing protein n=1 Tax=Austropuccinia psidii MF-1 TaxID=1389203 RepID=A0A9Q3IWK8_9BASI|nr:hypothetical protein [Austropuccinia psidii MF-1]